jgi:uncharacterized protein
VQSAEEVEVVSTEVTTRVGKFVWHEHASSDQAYAQEFYNQLLGWEFEVFKFADFDYPMITSAGQMHGGFPPVPEGTPPHWIGNVQVESVDDTVEKVKAAGGSVIVEPVEIPEVGRYALIADPQGADLAVFQPGADGQMGVGVFVWDELVTSDVDAAKAFYGEVFGWTANDSDMGGGFTYTVFKRGEDDAAGAMPLGEIPAPPHWLPYLATDDVDATAARAGELGATILREPWDVQDIGRLAIVQDPAGAVFGLFKPRS